MNTGIIVNGGFSGGALINASTGMRTNAYRSSVHPVMRCTCSCNRRPCYDIVCSPSLDYFSINRYDRKNDLTINA
ncbi:MAG: hypothetical protein ACREAS_01330, partial [Nitrososphaera sp.]